MPTLKSLNAMEILDSRGRPTVWAQCTLDDGAIADASVPSGASTGSAEALELRDGDRNRYRGLGCTKAVANIIGPIQQHLRGRDFTDQQSLDHAMLELDGTTNKSNLGANALLAVSIAFARACAASRTLPLYKHLADIAGHNGQTLPRLTVNLFSGGKHAGGQVCIQDVLLVPVSANTINQGLAMVWAVYQSAAELCLRKYNTRALKADEGGLAPPFASTEDMLKDAVEAITAAGFRPGQDVALAVDVASSHFYENGIYQFDGQRYSSSQMIDLIAGWINRYPLVSVEDALSEDDWANWPALRRAIGEKAMVLGDDFLCTNPARIGRAIESQCANALLLKVNQIGTLSEAAEALRLARSAGWRITISARSGETEDNWLADLSVGWGGDQIKVGSINQSERLAKYNRLLQIESQTHWPVINWPK
ncbi:MAG: phosphopyruvate hydratase [Phycisphaerales bacterium]|jgi:enolase|nr:phosphopyruvate hydratase [Phycisphaerales bacterium]